MGCAALLSRCHFQPNESLSSSFLPSFPNATVIALDEARPSGLINVCFRYDFSVSYGMHILHKVAYLLLGIVPFQLYAGSHVDMHLANYIGFISVHMPRNGVHMPHMPYNLELIVNVINLEVSKLTSWLWIPVWKEFNLQKWGGRVGFKVIMKGMITDQPDYLTSKRLRRGVEDPFSQNLQNKGFLRTSLCKTFLGSIPNILKQASFRDHDRLTWNAFTVTPCSTNFVKR